jgi:CheY-like chemotaxis protein
MKKIVIAIGVNDAFRLDKALGPTAVLFLARTTDEALSLHRAEKANLIITELGMPGISNEELCSTIRQDPELRRVSIILISQNTPEKIEQALRCRVNAVLLMPVQPPALLLKARQLLDVARREAYRVLVSLRGTDAGDARDTIFCRSRDISTTGMLVESDKQLAEGSNFSCTFLLPDSTDVVHSSVKIIRTADQASDVEGYQYGLMFTDISAQAKKQLAEYVEKKQPGSPPASP